MMAGKAPPAPRVQAALPADRYKSLTRGGLPYHQEIGVPVKGDYFIRTGIYDVTGNKIGAVELPVASVSKLPHPPNRSDPPFPRRQTHTAHSRYPKRTRGAP